MSIAAPLIGPDAPTGVGASDPDPNPPVPPGHCTTIAAMLSTAWEVRTSDPDQSRTLSERALLDATAMNDHIGIGLAQRNLGFHQFLKSDHGQAIQSLTEGLECAKELHDVMLMRDCLNYLGAVYSSLGDYSTSIEHVKAVLDLCTKTNDRLGIASALTNLGLLNYHLGKSDQAISLHQESISLSRELGNQTREMNALNNLGCALTELNRDQEAIEALRQVLSLAIELNEPDVQARALINMSDAHQRRWEMNTAMTLGLEALALVQASGNLEGEAHTLLSLARIHIKQHEYPVAIEVLEAGLRIAVQIGSKRLAYDYHHCLANTYRSLEQAVQALHHYILYHDLEREVQAEVVERQIRATNAQREIEKTRAESEIYRLRTVELANLLNSLQESNAQKSALLQELNEKSSILERQVKEDALTGVYNRRYLELMLAEEFSRSRQSDVPLSVIMLDIDHFKRINDQFSHQLGDEVIRTVAQLLVQNSRSSDLVARYGGEEFVIAMPGLPGEQALVTCERIRKAVENFDWSQFDVRLKVTISAGLSDDPAQSNYERLLHVADLNLYVAKNNGRNRTHYDAPHVIMGGPVV